MLPAELFVLNLGKRFNDGALGDFLEDALAPITTDLLQTYNRFAYACLQDQKYQTKYAYISHLMTLNFTLNIQEFSVIWIQHFEPESAT